MNSEQANNQDEPASKKKKQSSLDDSLKFFKTRMKKIKPPRSSSNATSSFINESDKPKPSTSKSKPKSKPKKQESVLKVKSVKSSKSHESSSTNKDDEKFHRALSKKCRDQGLDPEEVQMALAISESLKEQNDENSNQNIEIKGKSIAAKLERFGFKSQKKFNQIEFDLFANQKISKRSKFTKYPTVLTKTSANRRFKTNNIKFNRLMDRSMMTSEVINDDFDVKFQVSSYFLQDYHNFNSSVFDINSESKDVNDILHRYYVEDLFEPSNVPADHLLRNWSDIAGRDLSPPKKKRKSEHHDKNNDKKYEEEEVNYNKEVTQVENENVNEDMNFDDEFEIAETSCFDIFADDEKEDDENINLNSNSNSNSNSHDKESTEVLVTQLELLHQTISQPVCADIQMDIVEEDHHIIEEVQSCTTVVKQSQTSNIEILDLTSSNENEVVEKVTFNEENLDEVKVDLTLEDDSNSKNSTSELEALANALEEYEEIDLTQDDEEVTIPLDDSFHTLKKNLKQILGDDTQIISSEEHQGEGEDNVVEDEEENCTQNSSTLDDDDDVVVISDEEINYSVQQYQNFNEFKDKSNQSFPNEDEENDVIINICDQGEGFNQTLPDIDENDEDCGIDINQTVSNLLEISQKISNENSNSQHRMENNFSDSIQEIMRKYKVFESPSNNILRRVQSNVFEKSTRKSVQFSDDIENVVEDKDETLSNFEESFKENSQKFNFTIHHSLEDLTKEPNSPPRKEQLNREGTLNDNEYLIDIEQSVPGPEYESMTPLELKQALFKFGIRALPTKKAIAILNFIHEKIYPEITSSLEYNVNESRRALNVTDFIANIVFDDEDNFPFQPALIENENVVLPNPSRKKIPSCQIPLHISFFNMVRSNEKLQRFILEYRPIELDQVHQHFRKFGLTYETNEIIAFLDRRCITFKTKEKSLSKTYENKKKKKFNVRSRKR